MLFYTYTWIGFCVYYNCLGHNIVDVLRSFNFFAGKTWPFVYFMWVSRHTNTQREREREIYVYNIYRRRTISLSLSLCIVCIISSSIIYTYKRVGHNNKYKIDRSAISPKIQNYEETNIVAEKKLRADMMDYCWWCCRCRNLNPCERGTDPK